MISTIGGKPRNRICTTVLAATLALGGCAGTRQPNPADGARAGYFATSVRCLELSAYREKIRVPCGVSMAGIEVPLGHRPALFAACMNDAGFAPPVADAGT